MQRRKQSLRMALPIPWLAKCTRTLFSEPHSPPSSVKAVITSPRRITSPMPPGPLLPMPRMPSSTARRMSPGSRRSMSTSATMNSAAAMAKGR